MPFIERLSNDSAVGHALAFSLAIESATGIKVSLRSSLIRVLAAELERLTMHIHDISNIAGMGTGYTIMATQGFRIKEDLVRLSERFLGNRFWRGFVRIGGVARDLGKSDLKDIGNAVERAMSEIDELLRIGLESDGLIERMRTAVRSSKTLLSHTVRSALPLARYVSLGIRALIGHTPRIKTLHSRQRPNPRVTSTLASWFASVNSRPLRPSLLRFSMNSQKLPPGKIRRSARGRAKRLLLWRVGGEKLFISFASMIRGG